MVASRRARRTLSAHERARFLDALARTGNFAFACDAVGRAKSGLYKRRARDPAFAAECEAALAAFRLSSPSGGGGAQRRTGQCRGTLKTGPATLVLTRISGKGPAQLRRPGARRLTDSGVEAFLRTLAATANVRLAAASAGVAHSTIYYHRRHDPAFAEAMRQALELGYATLEERLVRGACDWLETGAQPPDMPGMTAELALSLLGHHRNTARLGGRLPDGRLPDDDMEGIRTRLERKMKAHGIIPW